MQPAFEHRVLCDRWGGVGGGGGGGDRDGGAHSESLSLDMCFS